MPRRARCYIPGLPYHIVQRGNNREACFIEPDDYSFYLELWQQSSRRNGVRVHAYCLMTNHIHVFATPDKAPALSNAMRVIGSRYAQYINHKYGRTGTLWEGRHRSSLVQSDKYLLICSRYIELNPVRTGLVTHPDEYPWSSHKANAWGDDSWLTPHEEYMKLGAVTEERTQAYRELFKHPLSEEELNLIRKAIHYSQPVGDSRFCAQIASNHGIRIGQMKRGRPKKKRPDELVKY